MSLMSCIILCTKNKRKNYKELVKLYKEVYERDIFHSSLGASKENCKKLKYAAEIYRITKL